MMSRGLWQALLEKAAQPPILARSIEILVFPGKMIQVNTDAHGLLVRPINMKVDGLDTSPFKQAHHKPGSQHLRQLP